MSYRPPNWENPDWGFSLFSGSNYERGKERYIAHEAGADAMLEALKARGQEVEDGDWPELDLIDRKGWLIFMPEEA